MPTMKVDTPMPLEIEWPESKNNTINYIAEIFELFMGEAFTSASREFGAGFLPKDKDRLKELLKVVDVALDTPYQDTPVLAAVSYAPEDVKPT